MLSHLSIRDIVLIDRLEIEFSNGLSVLSGETGAGKSILLDSLSLAIGGRGDAGLVRKGAKQGQVTAVFDVELTHPVCAYLQENAFECDGSVVLRRVQNPDGRTRVFINDQAASVGMMAEVGRLLVEFHGQHADRALVDPAHHRELLDAFGELRPDVAELSMLYHSWRQSDQTLAQHRAAMVAVREEAQYLQDASAELDQLVPMEGEEEELAARRALMMKSERLAGDVADAIEIISGNASPTPSLASLIRRLERKENEVPGLFDQVIAALDSALQQLDVASVAMNEVERSIEFDPAELEQVEERLFALRAAARKYSCTVEDLPQVAAKFVEQLDELEAGDEHEAELLQLARAAQQAYKEAAQSLSNARHQAAQRLEAAVMEELPALKLGKAKFMVNVSSDHESAGETGIDMVEFWVQTNPGTPAGPIMKIASGGELSRFLLALKVALADRGSAPTLVFDEIDTGVGGAVADAIGQRLRRLAGKVQVLSITHAPQVAARAQQHFLIAKSASNGKSVTTGISLLDKPGRQEEIARMLAGAKVSDEARAAAEKLLEVVEP